MNRPLATLLRYELRMLMRDTRTLLIAVVAPLVLFPGLLLVSRAVERSEEERIEATAYRWAATGDLEEWARETTQTALETIEDVTFEEVVTSAADSLLEAGELHLVVAGLSTDAWQTLENREDTTPPVTPILELRHQARSDFSRAALNALEPQLQAVAEQQRADRLRTAGLAIDPEGLWPVEAENVASAEREGGALLGLALTPLLLFLMLSGGSIVAADTISGEKERGTLETLLTSAARRTEIVRAKQLAIVAVGLAVALINVANLLVYLVFGVFELPENFAVAIGIGDALLLLLLFVPLAVLVSSSLLLLSGISKSYREYQIYFFPLFLVFLVPTLASVLPGMQLRSAIALVPIAGIGVAVREIMVGKVDLLFVALAFGSTALTALLVTRRTEAALSTERLISPSDLDEADLLGGPALFPKHVLRWFLGLWVLFFVVALWLGDSVGIRGQVVINLVGIFFGGSLVMMRRYRMDPRELLNLRAPRPGVWPAVLIGAPSALVVGAGVAQLVNTWLFPVPPEMLEAFGDTLTGGDEISTLQLLLFISIMPGIFEELAFRGALLNGLKRRLRPVALCLAVGLIFGLFHVSLFRIAPTATLGIVLSAVTLITGSIYPAMVWHALNNAIAILPAQMGWISADYIPPTWAYALAVGGLALAFGLLWRARSPLPGLRSMRAMGPNETSRSEFQLSR